jgi:hypothetical protein
VDHRGSVALSPGRLDEQTEMRFNMKAIDDVNGGPHIRAYYLVARKDLAACGDRRLC